MVDIAILTSQCLSLSHCHLQTKERASKNVLFFHMGIYVCARMIMKVHTKYCISIRVWLREQDGQGEMEYGNTGLKICFAYECNMTTHLHLCSSVAVIMELLSNQCNMANGMAAISYQFSEPLISNHSPPDKVIPLTEGSTPARQTCYNPAPLALPFCASSGQCLTTSLTQPSSWRLQKVQHVVILLYFLHCLPRSMAHHFSHSPLSLTVSYQNPWLVVILLYMIAGPHSDQPPPNHICQYCVSNRTCNK